MFANWYRELQTMIDEGYYYVDKTLFIKEVLNEKVALYTRPRRFHRIVSRYLWYPTRGALVAGKTLNMSRRCPPRRAILFLFYERERECVSSCIYHLKGYEKS